jgi:hypothetical protein
VSISFPVLFFISFHSLFLPLPHHILHILYSIFHLLFSFFTFIFALITYTSFLSFFNLPLPFLFDPFFDIILLSLTFTRVQGGCAAAKFSSGSTIGILKVQFHPNFLIISYPLGPSVSPAYK